MEETTTKKPGGKREGQKYKSLLVWDILLKKTDENHALQLKDIKEHLAHYGITAERHSIKRDIDDILALLNKVNSLVCQSKSKLIIIKNSCLFGGKTTH